MADDQQRADAIEQMVAITAAEDDIGRRSCEELLRASDWNIEVNLMRSNKQLRLATD
jgi:hypothetical protein